MNQRIKEEIKKELKNISEISEITIYDQIIAFKADCYYYDAIITKNGHLKKNSVRFDGYRNESN